MQISFGNVLNYSDLVVNKSQSNQSVAETTIPEKKNSNKNLAIGLGATALGAATIALIAIKKRNTQGAEDVQKSVQKQAEQLKPEFSHLVESIPKTPEEFGDRVYNIVDLLCEKMNIKVKPRVSVHSDFSDSLKALDEAKKANDIDLINNIEKQLGFVVEGAYHSDEHILSLDKSFIDGDMFWVKLKGKSGKETVLKDEGGNNLHYTSFHKGKVDDKYPTALEGLRERGWDENQEIEFIKMTDSQKMLAFIKATSHELRHYKQVENIFCTEGLGVGKFCEMATENPRRVLNLSPKEILDEAKEDIIRAYEIPPDEIENNSLLSRNILGQVATSARRQAEDVLSKFDNLEKKLDELYKPYKDLYKKDSEEGKLAQGSFDYFKNFDSIEYMENYEDVFIEKDAYKFQQDFAKENFAKLFGCTEKEALLV